MRVVGGREPNFASQFDLRKIAASLFDEAAT